MSQKAERCTYETAHWRCGKSKGHDSGHEFLGEPPDPEYFERQRNRAKAPRSPVHPGTATPTRLGLDEVLRDTADWLLACARNACAPDPLDAMASATVLRDVASQLEVAGETIRELRRKLAEAGVEGSPPIGRVGTIPALLSRAQTAEAALRAAERERDYLAERVEALEAQQAAWLTRPAEGGTTT